MSTDDTPTAPGDGDGDGDGVVHTIQGTGDKDRPVLEITGGEGNLDDCTEVHLLMRSTCDCCEDFAQGWFRVEELRAAIAAAIAARPDGDGL